jgi:regulator of nonsense transcripts 2
MFPELGVSSPLDAPHDFFRVRLCCALLESCGPCFDRGKTAAQLDEFLAFLQVYAHSKGLLTMDVEFLIAEIFELLRPRLVLTKSYEDAVVAFEKVVIKRSQNIAPAEFVSEDDDLGDEAAFSSRTVDHMSGEEDSGRADEQTSDVDSHAGSAVEEMAGQDGESIVVLMPEEVRDEDEDADFEREFSKMMQESIESKKNERKPVVFDVAVPGRVKLSSSVVSEDFGNSDSVMFTLLTKKGNKQQVRSFLCLLIRTHSLTLVFS